MATWKCGNFSWICIKIKRNKFEQSMHLIVTVVGLLHRKNTTKNKQIKAETNVYTYFTVTSLMGIEYI